MPAVLRRRGAAAPGTPRTPLPVGLLAPAAPSPPPKPGLEASPAARSTAPSTPRAGAAELFEILRRSPPSRPSSCGRSLGSTSAGLTPRRPAPSDQSPCSDRGGRPGPAASPEGGEGGGRCPRQCRKIFVGGVPQEVDREDLSAMFSGCGTVERAWLQRHRRDLRRNHRGFGFVLFRDAASVRALLGDHFSRFFDLPDGTRLEVKRALDHTEEAPTPQRDGCALEPGHLLSPPRTAAVAAAPLGVEVAMVPPAPCTWTGQAMVIVPAAPGPLFAPMPVAQQLASEQACRRALEAMLIQAMPDHYED
mmetsp:Transcript_56725/g.161658  ORF Transcript_56725/g.161658 Transcript_56725/m.161658 type:complete len:306 (+) Transcript_56725:93-1010(+)